MAIPAFFGKKGSMRLSETFRSLDWVAGIAMLLLIALGLAMVGSSTYTEGAISGLFIRQLVSAAVSFIAFGLFAWISYHTISRFAPALYLATFLGLVFVALFGTLVRGTVSRLVLFGVQIQPSEFMKVGLVVGLSWLLARAPRLRPKAVLVSALLVALPSGLVILEPDLGVAALMIALWVILLVFRGVPWKVFLVILLAAALAFGAGWQWFFADYQRQRLVTFLDPTSDPLGAGYNIVQSIVALGSGQLLGRGLGHGPQSQLQFLPERHTDFILASIGEELGFLGVIVVVALYSVLLWRILKIARTTQSSFGQLLCVSVFVILLVSFFVSVGMNMGLLPVTGIPLPLVSFGGSNLLSTCILLGIVQSVRIHSHWNKTPPAEIIAFT